MGSESKPREPLFRTGRVVPQLADRQNAASGRSASTEFPVAFSGRRPASSREGIQTVVACSPVPKARLSRYIDRFRVS